MNTGGFSFSRPAAASTRLSGVNVSPIMFADGRTFVAQTNPEVMAQAAAQIAQNTVASARSSVTDMSAIAAGILSAGKSVGDGMAGYAKLQEDKKDRAERAAYQERKLALEEAQLKSKGGTLLDEARLAEAQARATILQNQAEASEDYKNTHGKRPPGVTDVTSTMPNLGLGEEELPISDGTPLSSVLTPSELRLSLQKDSPDVKVSLTPGELPTLPAYRLDVVPTSNSVTQAVETPGASTKVPSEKPLPPEFVYEDGPDGKPHRVKNDAYTQEVTRRKAETAELNRQQKTKGNEENVRLKREELNAKKDEVARKADEAAAVIKSFDDKGFEEILRSTETYAQNAASVIQLIEGSWISSAGATGDFLKNVPLLPFDAKQVANALVPLKANKAFETLAKIKSQSPSGSALGAVSDREMRLLENTDFNLDQSTDPTELIRNLKASVAARKRFVENVKTRRRFPNLPVIHKDDNNSRKSLKEKAYFLMIDNEGTLTPQQMDVSIKKEPPDAPLSNVQPPNKP